MLPRQPSQRSTMRTYSQLAQAQRYQIYALRKTRHSLAEIATVIGVHKSSVSRELERNRGKRGYRPQQAQELALERRQKAVPRITAEIWTIVERLLRQDWSPEQVSGRLKKEQSRVSVMSGSINIFWQINEPAAICISICVAKRNAANAMERMIDGANCPIVAVSKSVQPS